MKPLLLSLALLCGCSAKIEFAPKPVNAPETNKVVRINDRAIIIYMIMCVTNTTDHEIKLTFPYAYRADSGGNVYTITNSR